MSLFLLCLDLLTYAKQEIITRRQNNKEKKQKNWKCHQLWLDSWTKEGLGKQNKCTDKRRGVENGSRQWETLNQLLFHMFHSHVHRHMHPELHTLQSKTKAAWLCFSVALGWRERKRERKREQLPVGADGAAPAPHRRITLERTHHLCSFVELSHFNPRLGPFGNQLTPLHPTQSPTAEPPLPLPLPNHSGLQLSALPPLYCSSLVSGTHSQHSHTNTHTHTHQSHPNNWPASCLSRTPGGGGEDGGLTLWRYVGLCALQFYCYLREKRRKREKSI